MRYVLLAILLLVLLQTQAAYAVSDPAVNFIPPRFTANSNFLMIAETAEDPVRVSWVVPGPGFYGQFPKVDGKHICYFSNTDKESNCGPYPLVSNLTGNLTMIVSATNSLGEKADKNVYIDVGGIRIDPVIDIKDNDVSVVIFPSSAITTAKYAVYDSVGKLVQNYRGLECKIETFYQCVANFSLEDGEYYLSFTVEGSEDFGGNLVRIAVGGVSSDGKDAAATKVKTDPVVWSSVIFPNQVQTKLDFKMYNTGNETIPGLVVRVPSELTKYLSITLQNTTLGPYDQTFFTARISNIDSAINITTAADVYSQTNKVGTIPINIYVSVKQSSGPVAGSTILASPESFSGDFLVGQTTSQEFAIVNPSDRIIVFGQTDYIGDIEGIATAAPPSGIQPGLTGTITISLNPPLSGSYEGAVILPSDVGIVVIPVSVRFFDNIQNSLSSLENNFETFKQGLSEDKLSKIQPLLDDIGSEISSTKASLSSKDYSQAQVGYEKANAMLDLLKDSIGTDGGDGDGGGGLPIDTTTIMMVVIVIVVLLLVFVALKKFKKVPKGKKGPKGDDDLGDEEFEQELEEEEEF